MNLGLLKALNIKTLRTILYIQFLKVQQKILSEIGTGFLLYFAFEVTNNDIQYHKLNHVI